MNAAPPPLLVGFDVSFAIAEHRMNGGIKIDLARAHVPVPDDVTGGLRHEPIALLALGQRRTGSLARGNVLEVDGDSFLCRISMDLPVSGVEFSLEHRTDLVLHD